MRAWAAKDLIVPSTLILSQRLDNAIFCGVVHTLSQGLDNAISCLRRIITEELLDQLGSYSITKSVKENKSLLRFRTLMGNLQ